MSSINGIKVSDNFIYGTTNSVLYRVDLYPNVTALGNAPYESLNSYANDTSISQSRSGLPFIR